MGTNVAAAPALIFQFLNNSGQMNAGGSLLTQVGGVNYPTFQDANGNTPLPNPIPLNSRGEISNSSGVSSQLFLAQNVTYVMTLFDANNNAIWTANNVTAQGAVTTGNMTDEKGSGGTVGFAAGVDFAAGTTTTLTLSGFYGSTSNLWVAFDGDEQGADSYSLSGFVLTFNAPIPGGVNKVYVKGGTTLTIGTPGTGTVTDASVAANAAINASKISVPQSGAGGVAITLAAALANPINVKRFGATGNGTTDDTTSVQACLTYALGVGGTVYFPTGTYKLSAQLTINYTGSAFPGPRVMIEGDGPGNSVLQWAAGGTGGLLVQGSQTGAGILSHQKISNIALVKGDNNASGLALVNLAYFEVENIYSSGWNIGVQAQDCLSGIFTNVNSQFNVGGGLFQRVSFSDPNALTFNACTFGNNTNYGIDAQNCSAFTYIGGAIESNFSNTVTPPIWGCRVVQTQAIPDGNAFASFHGVYIENNGSTINGNGQADIWYDNIASQGTLNVIGCTFNRHSDFCTNAIQIQTSGGFRHKVTLLGNSHKNYSDYTASASRPYVQVVSTTDPIQLIDLGNLYDSATEAPNYSGSTGMPATPIVPQSQAAAWVRFNGSTGAITQSFNVSSVTRNSVGNYTINYARNLQNASNCWSICFNGLGFFNVLGENASQLNIQTSNMSGTATDYSSISTTVFGGILP